MNNNLEVIFEKFDVKGEYQEGRPYGNGHINDTYCVTTKDEVRYILQRINKNVFPKPIQVISNIEKATDFIKNKLFQTDTYTDRSVLTLIPCKDGKKYFIDENDEYWRLYPFIEGSLSLELPEDEKDFYQSAVAFGNFQYLLSDFPAEKLYETIPDFHNTPKRYKNFLSAVKADKCNRAKSAEAEIAFVTERESFYGILENKRQEGLLPLKVTHNDTKMNNVLLDSRTRKALCVIDLDTIMPGFSVNDFGDSIRFGASTAAEDEKDLSKVHFDLNLYKTYVKGFLEGCCGSLTDEEVEMMPYGAKMMTMECGMRFLTDYLSGDTYFKTKYPEHNLVRCRTQFKLVKEMEENFDKMREIKK